MSQFQSKKQWDPTYVSWGRYPKSESLVKCFKERNETWATLTSGTEAELTWLPRGRGRSYGDSCLNHHQGLLSSEYLRRFIHFDEKEGLLKVESGVTFREILDQIVPRGWFLPVVPGTEEITVGGAIANDIHGKNHHVAGTFGRHVQSFELLRSDGSRRTCSETEHSDWYRATIGGLGLTGFITWAEIRLKKIISPWITKETLRFRSLAQFFEYSMESDQHYEYTVGWMDCLAEGSGLGRGVFFRGNHLPMRDVMEKIPSRKPKSFPWDAPGFLLNRSSIKAFNTLYYFTHPSRKGELVHYRPFFFPLDGILHWNRLYGKRGFFQYQCVVPFEGCESPLHGILQFFVRSGLGSFLTVIKTFGNLASPGMLSFPRPGVTLTLDIPNEGEKTLRVLDALDARVMDAGGRVYPAKDARMSKESFAKYFPEKRLFEKMVDPKCSSSFWRRVT